jgi:hypothetical protein
MIGMWLAIPVGIAIQLRPSIIIILTVLGATAGSFLVGFFGTGLRQWLPVPCRKIDPYDEKSLVHKIWIRYGIIGLGIFAPLVTGVPMGTAIALALGGDRRTVSVCMVSGIILWSVILTLAAVLGAAALGLG